MRLLGVEALERSDVVANCRMNRERSLIGSNGYAADLGFNPLTLLEERAVLQDRVRWLDLCCGSGKALIEAAQTRQCPTRDPRFDSVRFEMVGVDLVGMFLPHAELKSLRLVEVSLSTWEPDRPFDLITCVHGLHYVGDKLGLIERALSWLTDEGRFTANLDLNNFKFPDGRPAGRRVAATLRRNGVQYQSRKKLLDCTGRRAVKFLFPYLGADNAAGPNYTGQPAVDSCYSLP